MTQKEINDYNSMCAEFLGSELKNDGQFDYWTYDHLDFHPIKISGSSWVSGNFEFHSDWNWIHEVVEAIEKLYDDFHGHFIVYISSNSCTIQGTKLNTTSENFHPAYFSEYYGSDKKEAVVQAINQFLIWYNNKH